jgi:hypothetical protein
MTSSNSPITRSTHFGHHVGHVLQGPHHPGTGLGHLRQQVPGEELGGCVHGGAASENAGTSIAGAGDLDGDGADDFLVGAPGRAGVGASAGAVYVIAGLPSGSLSLSEAAWARIDAGTSGDKLGQAVAGGVDVDGDGTPDLLLGAPYEDAGGTSAGAAYLFSGAGL